MRVLFLLVVAAAAAVLAAPQPPGIARQRGVQERVRGEGLQPPPALDGSGHGQRGLRGGAGTLMRRLVEKFNTPVDTVTEDGFPNARASSNALSKQFETAMPHPDGLSAAVWWLGQFIDHDITFSKDVGEDIFIDVTGDEHFDPEGEGDFISIRRSDFLYDEYGTRQFVNDVTSFLDLSAVYGARNYRGQFVREFSNGLLRSIQVPGAGELPPYNTHGLPNLGGDFNEGKFLVGDFRGNEQAFLLANHVLFLRNHNYWARHFHEAHPTWDDDRVFNAARRWNVAEFQSIVYDEYLPALVGDRLGEAEGYSPVFDPAIITEFAGAGWRVGHTFLNDHLELRNPTTGAVETELLLRDAFQDTSEVEQHGIDRLALGIAHTTANQVDVRLVDAVREFLFLGPGFSVNLDLAAMNILRGREMALPTLNELREHYLLPRHQTFADVTSDEYIATKMGEMFDHVDKLDLWFGLLQENHAEGSTFGETLTLLIVEQYKALRDGDLYYYEYDPSLSREDREEIRATTYSDIIARNSNIPRSLLQDNIFKAQ